MAARPDQAEDQDCQGVDQVDLVKAAGFLPAQDADGHNL